MMSKVRSKGQQAQGTGKADMGQDERYLVTEAANTVFAPVVKWLQERSVRERVLVSLVSEIMLNDGHLENAGLYKGNLSNDLFNDTDDEIADHLGDADYFGGPETARMADLWAVLSAGGEGHCRDERIVRRVIDLGVQVSPDDALLYAIRAADAAVGATDGIMEEKLGEMSVNEKAAILAGRR